MELLLLHLFWLSQSFTLFAIFMELIEFAKILNSCSDFDLTGKIKIVIKEMNLTLDILGTGESAGNILRQAS